MKTLLSSLTLVLALGLGSPAWSAGSGLDSVCTGDGWYQESEMCQQFGYSVAPGASTAQNAGTIWAWAYSEACEKRLEKGQTYRDCWMAWRAGVEGPVVASNPGATSSVGDQDDTPGGDGPGGGGGSGGDGPGAGGPGGGDGTGGGAGGSDNGAPGNSDGDGGPGGPGGGGGSSGSGGPGQGGGSGGNNGSNGNGGNSGDNGR